MTNRRTSNATKRRILDAAERLIAQHPYHGISLRMITSTAKANLAAVNYYFSDKETLFRELILRRIRPLNSLRVALLDEACTEAGSASPPLEQIFRILAEPVFDLHRDSQSGGRALAQLLARVQIEPSNIFSKLLADEYNPLLNRFGQVIRRHVPQLSPEEFLWRFSFIIGALHHTVAIIDQMQVLTQGICRNDDYEGALARFISHSIATLQNQPNRIGN